MKDEYYEFDEQKFLNEYHFENWEYHTDTVAECNDYMPLIFQNDKLSVRGDIFIVGQPKDEVFFKVFRINKISQGNYDVLGVCRISMISPEYVTGYDENMILTNDEIEFIVQKFKENDYGFWKLLLDQTNDYLDTTGCEIKFDVDNTPMPDYELLKKEV